MKLKAYVTALLSMALALNTGAGSQAAQPAGNRPVKDKWALVVGISKFDNPTLNLKYPAKDAQDFYNYLVTEGNFQKDHVKLVTNGEASRKRILSLIGGRWLPRVAHPDDLVVIYISSHGSPATMDTSGVNYLLAHDTDVDDLYATGIPMQDLARIIKGRVHSDRVVVMLDACHSGAASPESKGLYVSGNINVDEVVQGTGQMVISSSEPSQVSWESKQQENSVFTRHLLAALRSKGQATRLSDAFEQMKDKVQSEVLEERGVMQTPVMKSKWEGSDLVLAAVPVAPRPAPVWQMMTPEASKASAADTASSSKDITRTPAAAATPAATPPDEDEELPRDIFGPLATRRPARSKPSAAAASRPAGEKTQIAMAAPAVEPSVARAPEAADKQTWWTEFQKKEESSSQVVAAAPAAADAPVKGTASGGASGSASGAPEIVAGSVRQSYFSVPAYFANQPRPYERPSETFRASSFNDSTLPSGPALGGLSAALPWTGYGYGLGFGGPWLGRSWASPLPVLPFGGAVAPLPGHGLGYGLGGWGHGFGYGLPGLAGAYPYGPGFGWGGWAGGYGSAALWAGATIRPSSRLGGPGGQRVFQSAPSKASGNYYAPSTIDTTASGSYYANTTPSMTPAMTPQKPVTNFYGGSDPYGKDNTMPWNR